MPVQTIQWKNAALFILDQTQLPNSVVEIKLDTVEKVWDAIKTLKVRGAPAIGICAAFGIVVAAIERNPADGAGVQISCRQAIEYLATSRPTAVNLFWALKRMGRVLEGFPDPPGPDELIAALETEALNIFEEDKRICRDLGEHGAPLIQDGDGVLTHCNAGGLATADYGTALAILFRAHELGRSFNVFADETRPLLQGARLTVWELMQAGIDVTLICDSAAGRVMAEGKIQRVVVGADRIAANGDTANKIGTYSVALLAQAHDIPFYVGAPTSTIDSALATGADIPIEERDGREVTHGFGMATAPAGVNVYNPAFDVTPHGLISGIVTEKGVLRPPYEESIRACLAQPGATSRQAF